MDIQPLTTVKVWRLWWSCWTSLFLGPIWGQSAPYFFQCQEQHWNVCRLADLADTAGIQALESESLLPRAQSVLRQWYDEGAHPTMEWHFSEEVDAWREPLQRLRWTPSGISMMQRGAWVSLGDEEAPEVLPFPETLTLPMLQELLPPSEVLTTIGAISTDQDAWTWSLGDGWSIAARANPPEWTWFHDDGRVERWEFAPLGSAWYIRVEETIHPKVLSTGACVQEWSWVERTPLEGFEGQVPEVSALVLSPNPHDLGEVSLSLNHGAALQPTAIEFRDVQGRIAWSTENTAPFPLFIQPQLAPGRYTAWAHFGPFSLQAPFLQL